MAQDYHFMRESAFWYFLARRAHEQSASSLARLLESLEHRATELSLRIQYPREHATACAVVLQLVAVTTPYRSFAGRFGLEMMFVGFDRVFRPKGFSKELVERLLHNFDSPAFPGRTTSETIVDTFLFSAMKLARRSNDELRDAMTITETCLTDDVMLNCGAEAVRPPERLWETTSAEYLRRRPGFFRRQFLDANVWLFD